MFNHLLARVCILIIAVAVLVGACSSGDDSKFTGRSDEKASISNDNARDIAVGVTSSVDYGYSDQLLEEIALAIQDAVQAAIDNGDFANGVVNGSCGGDIALPDKLSIASPVSGTLVFNSFCVTGTTYFNDVILTGQADFEIVYDQTNTITNISLQLSEVTIDKDGEVATLNGSITADKNAVTATLTLAFTGLDGRQYEAVDFEIVIDFSGGVSASGTVRDPDHGSVHVQTTEAVFFNCINGKPGSGKIEVTGSSVTTMEISFISCTQYQVCLNNNTTCNVFNW